MAAIDDVKRFIADRTDLGEVVSASPVAGGFMHKMYKLETARGAYALKLLDPEVVARPDAAANFDRAEALEDIVFDAGVSVSCALSINGKKRLCACGRQFYLFDWIDGKTLMWSDISPYHTEKIGALLGSIHTITRRISSPHIDPVDYDWHLIADELRDSPHGANDVADAIESNAGMLSAAAHEYNDVIAALPPLTTITDGDMDPKNVMWTGNDAEHPQSTPTVVDLECLDYGSPFADAWILAMSWSGVPVCEFDGARCRAFLDAYMRTTGLDINAEALYGLGYSWLDWLGYNAKRAAGECGRGAVDIGKAECMATLDRIMFYRQNRGAILRAASM